MLLDATFGQCRLGLLRFADRRRRSRHSSCQQRVGYLAAMVVHFHRCDAVKKEDLDVGSMDWHWQ